MKLADARRYALSLPETTEAPHHHMTSFRVRGKIFATAPPEATHLHVFVGEEDRAPLIASEPGTYEALWWGAKVMGVRVTLATADATTLKALLMTAWRGKAPAALR